MSGSFHLHVSDVFGRGKNRPKTAISEAAYMDRTRYLDEKTDDKTKNYGREKGKDVTGDVLFSGLFFAHEEARKKYDQNREKFWNEVSRKAKRRDAQEAQGMIVDFLDGMTQQQREYMLKDFIREEFLRGGYGVHAVIHRPSPGGDSRNHHAHLLWALRDIKQDGSIGRPLPMLDAERIIKLREKWAALGARQLERSGRPKEEIDRQEVAHLTLEKQAQAAWQRGDIAGAQDLQDREATEHEGRIHTAARRRGESTPRTRANDLKRERTRIRQQARLAERSKLASEPKKGRSVDRNKVAAAREKVNKARDVADPFRPISGIIRSATAAMEIVSPALKIIDGLGSAPVTPQMRREAREAQEEQEHIADERRRREERPPDNSRDR